MERAGIDRLGALLTAIDVVRRGGTLSISGMYGGAVDQVALAAVVVVEVERRRLQGEHLALGLLPCPAP